MCHRAAELEGTLWGLCPNPLFQAGSTLKSEQGYLVTPWKPPRTEIPQPLRTPVLVLHYLHSHFFFPYVQMEAPPIQFTTVVYSPTKHVSKELGSVFLVTSEKLPLKSPPLLLLLIRGRCTPLSLLCGTFSSSFFHANLDEFHTHFFSPVMLRNAVIAITFDFIKSNYALLEPTIF